MNDRITINTILLAHGGGGRLTHELVSKIFKSKFNNPILDLLDDSAAFEIQVGALNLTPLQLAFTTDSYVVKPFFFPGGDIGKLAICGTVNDLSMKGAKPLYLSAAFIIEEGLEISILKRIVDSMVQSAREAEVQVVAGDTKVVEKGSGDGLFITTTGVGVIEDKSLKISGSNAEPGDLIILSGSVGEHGMAVMNARHQFGFESEFLKSDCAPLNSLVTKMLETNQEIHTLRDPTRGGLATTLNEIAQQSKVGIFIDERKILVKEEVKGACELLGIDPLYVANEGKLVTMVKRKSAEKILEVMHTHPYGKEAVIIGEVKEEPVGVFLQTEIGGTRPLLMLEAEQLPRIC
ncbi:MAG: hydrogenase expression/formation protein HypE [Candidatus Edwardsbacteria bacterium]